MGNIGCMLNCDYCHNWKTSQARFVSDADVYHYTPEAEVVDIATAARHPGAVLDLQRPGGLARVRDRDRRRWPVRPG